MIAGEQLREIRGKRGLTLREVEAQSRDIATRRDNIQYLFTAARLSQVESSKSLPSMYKLATLREVYDVPLTDLLKIYGIEIPADSNS